LLEFPVAQGERAREAAQSEPLEVRPGVAGRDQPRLVAEWKRPGQFPDFDGQGAGVVGEVAADVVHPEEQAPPGVGADHKLIADEEDVFVRAADEGAERQAAVGR